MRWDGPIDILIRDIHALDRDGCIGELVACERPRLDFTQEFLETLPLEQLRHVLMAACLQARKGACPDTEAA